MELNGCVSLFAFACKFIMCVCFTLTEWPYIQKYEFPCKEEDIISKTNNITNLSDCGRLCYTSDGCVSFLHQSNQCILCGYYYFENRGHKYDEGFYSKKTVVNVALQKPVEVNNVTAPHYAASQGVDGNIDSHFDSGSCILTVGWWYVNLLKVYKLKGILIFNTIDCCFGKPAHNISVMVGNTLEGMSVVAYWPGDVEDIWYIPLPIGTTGQYVKILVDDIDEYLHFCEVEVFAPVEGLANE